MSTPSIPSYALATARCVPPTCKSKSSASLKFVLLYFLGKVLIFMFQGKRDIVQLLPKVLCYYISDCLTPNSYSFSPIKLPPSYMKTASNFFLSFFYPFSLSPLPFQGFLSEEWMKDFCGNFPACVTKWYLLQEQGPSGSSPSLCIYQLLTEYYGALKCGHLER